MNPDSDPASASPTGGAVVAKPHSESASPTGWVKSDLGSDQNRSETTPPQGMITGRGRRRTGVERVSMRVLATGGIIGVAVALGAILGAQNVAGWIMGLAIGVITVTLAAVLWSSRQL